MSFPYAALPLGFLIMFFLTVEDFLESLGVRAKGESR
jgi:TRAP-type C4-dicarboxylate transport system permease small subunit